MEILFSQHLALTGMEKLTIKAGNVFKSCNGDKMTGWEIVTCGKVPKERY